MHDDPHEPMVEQSPRLDLGTLNIPPKWRDPFFWETPKGCIQCFRTWRCSPSPRRPRASSRGGLCFFNGRISWMWLSAPCRAAEGHGRRLRLKYCENVNNACWPQQAGVVNQLHRFMATPSGLHAEREQLLLSVFVFGFWREEWPTPVRFQRVCLLQRRPFR